MLKKYAKRFSRTVMGGLGPGIRRPGAAVLLSPGDTAEASSEKFRWPPQSRKVVDDELVIEQTTGGESIGKPKRGTLIAKDICRVHLSSCSTTEEGFGSGSSLDVSSKESQDSSKLIRTSSSTSTSSSVLSSVSSSSDGLLDMINQLRCTLYYYALVPFEILKKTSFSFPFLTKSCDSLVVLLY